MIATPMRMNLPIVKVDEEQRIVWGIATREEIDKHGDIVDYEASKKAFANWIGNIREMHGDKAVGKRIDVQFDDENQQVMLGAYISRSVDGENAWQKVKEEILRGFSIGGRMNAIETRKSGDEDVRVIVDYELTEVSLVDNPACPSALFQMVKSADGALQRTEEMLKGSGRAVKWHEIMYKYATSQNEMGSSVLVYDKDRMAKKDDIKKDIWSASEMLYIGRCLAEQVYMRVWNGENVDELINAVKAIKDAAGRDLKEDERWPEAEMEYALKTLNLTKKEVEDKMAEEAKNTEVTKTVTGAEDRDANAEVVTTAEENGRPVNDTKERAEEAGVPVAGEVTTDEDGNEVVQDTVTDEAYKPTAVADGAEAAEGEEADGEKEDAKASKKNGKKSVETGDIAKSTDDVMVKSILAGVETLIDQKIAPLKEQVEKFSSAPAEPKAKGTFTVEKAEQIDTRNDAEKQLEELLKEADQYDGQAASSPADVRKRMDLAKKIRKAQSLADPARAAKYAEIKAQY